MTQPPLQPPKYRRSWLGRVIVAALVVQWAGLWWRSLGTWDAIYVSDLRYVISRVSAQSVHGQAFLVVERTLFVLDDGFVGHASFFFGNEFIFNAGYDSWRLDTDQLVMIAP